MIATTIGRKVAVSTQYLADVTISSSGITGWLKDNALPLIIFVIGLGLLGAGGAQDTSKKSAPPSLKSVSCAPECGFMARTQDEKELIEIVKAHAKQMHGKELTDAQVREMMKTAKPTGS